MSEALSENYTKVIEATTDTFDASASFDIEMASDNLKYSTWVTALSTAGVAVILTNFDKLLTNSWLSKEVIIFMIILSAIVLITAIVMGAFVHKLVNTELVCFRFMSGIMLLQKLDLLCKDEISDDLPTMKRKILSMSYLSSEKKDDYDGFAQAQKNARTKYRKLIFFQQVLTVIGYILMLLGAVKKPYT